MLFNTIIYLTIFMASTVHSAPMPLAEQIEILRINGVDERSIERTLNPNHVHASAFESPFTGLANTPNPSHLQHIIHHHTSKSHSPDSDLHFTSTIDGYSTAKVDPNGPSPASASLGNLASLGAIQESSSSQGAFEKVRRWLKRREAALAMDGGDMIVTGRMGDLKVRGR